MTENIFDLESQYKMLYESLDFGHMGLTGDQQEVLHMMFMSGALIVFDLLTIGVANMPEDEAVKTMGEIKEQLKNSLMG